jgi:hypothetical protein
MPGFSGLVHWRRNRTFALVSSLTVASLGGVAVAGWLLHSEALKTIIPGALPMRPNMAAGMLLCGAALALLSLKNVGTPIRVCVMAMAATVIVLAAVTLGEHLLDWDVGTEEWPIGGIPGALGSAHPGRVSPVTALCFFVVGSALCLASGFTNTRSRLSIAAGFSGALAVIGALALAGFCLEMLFGPRWNYMGISVSDILGAVGFMLLGSGLWALLQSKSGLTWSMDGLTTVGFAFGVLLMIAAAATAFTFMRQMLETTGWVTQRQEVLRGIQELMSRTADLASSERVYSITGDEQSLRERAQTKASLNQALPAVRALTSDNPTQQRILDQLQALVVQRIDWEEQMIAARRREGLSEAAEMVATGPGLKLASDINTLLARMQSEEYRLLDLDRKRAETATTTAFLVLPLDVFLSLTILSLALFFLNSGVAERKQAEGALRLSEERQRAILNSALDCVITMDHQGRVVEFNPAAEKTFGYERDRAIGQSLSELIIPASLCEQHQRGLLRLLSTGEARALGKRLELSALRHDGSEFPVEVAIVRIGKQEPPMFTGFIRDITERKQAEMALRQAEEKYRGIFENAVEGIFQTTPEGAYLSVNPALAHMYGYDSPEELTGSVSDIGRIVYVNPERRAEFKRLIEGQGSVEGFEYEVYRKDGRRIWLSENARAVRDGNGVVAYYEGTVEDVTASKRAKDALRASEAYLQTVVENLDEGVVVSDLKGQLLHWNRAALNIHGLRNLEEGLRSVGDFVDTFEVVAMDGAPVPVEEWPINRILRGEHLHDLELRVRNKRANWERIFDYGGTLVRDANNRPLMAIVTVSNITERKQAEARLLEQANIINRAQDAIIIRTFADEVITFWNKGAEHVYGWSANEMLGKPIGQLIFADEKEREDSLKQLVSTGEFHGELKQVAKDGREIIVNTRATLIRNADGVPRSVLLINTDVTEQKKLETQLLRSQRLESIGTLASGVAHDLNNVLVPILMASHALRGNVSTPESASLVSMIEESGRRGAEIVKQVLTFARGVEGERVKINPRHLIDEIADIARKTFPKSIKIFSGSLEDLWSIEGDPTQLHQVLLNLALNARDAMPDGGSLSFAAENFIVDEHYASITPNAAVGPHVVLRVSDSGSGMPRVTLDKIFDPFFTTKEVGKGTGLGLSTALGIVKSHGGFISVYSELGKGTTFKIFLPSDISNEDIQKSESAAAPMQGNGEQILVVDDEPNILQMTKMIFEKHNYRVLSANDGPEALALFAQQMGSIGGVITDVAMPYMDGVALVRSLKKMKSDIPIIASTGQVDQPGIAELRSLGVKNFLMKPYNTEKLLATVHDTLQGGEPVA